MDTPIQNLSQICDKILAAENQDVVEAASDHISVGTERENIEEELAGQDIREQGEGGATSADEACKEQDSGPESEEERQAQSSIKPLQASFHVNGSRSLAHNHQQHLHRLGS